MTSSFIPQREQVLPCCWAFRRIRSTLAPNLCEASLSRSAAVPASGPESGWELGRVGCQSAPSNTSSAVSARKPARLSVRSGIAPLLSPPLPSLAL
eukprot:scaffold252216_cov30-Tisochrysis_lutea.AAC.1